MTYQSQVLKAAATSNVPPDASDRFRADVRRVLLHQRRENRTGIIRNLRIPTPKSEVSNVA